MLGLTFTIIGSFVMFREPAEAVAELRAVSELAE
jgi:hypothetical protein